MYPKRSKIFPMTPWKGSPCEKDELPTKKDVCPECGEEDWPLPKQRCICHDPLFIAIPPGKHIHIHCPVHGDVKVYGPRITWMAAKGPVSYAARM